MTADIFALTVSILKKCVNNLKDGISGSSKTKNKENKSNQNLEITEAVLNKARATKKYGNFVLTNAVSIYNSDSIEPIEGYRIDQYVTPEGVLIGRLTASASAEKLLEIFDDLLQLINDSCGVVIEDYNQQGEDHIDHYAYHKDISVVRSIFNEYDNLLLHNGFLGFAVFEEDGTAEVQLTDHKVFRVFSTDVTPFCHVLHSYNIQEKTDIRFFYEAEHFHFAADGDEKILEALMMHLNIDQSIIGSGNSSDLLEN